VPFLAEHQGLFVAAAGHPGLARRGTVSAPL
jgi:hypothetical protein